jgi:hypothetical protein
MLKIKILSKIVAHAIWIMTTSNSEKNIAEGGERMVKDLEALVAVDPALASKMALSFMNSFDSGAVKTSGQDLRLDSDPTLLMAIYAGNNEYLKRFGSVRERIRAIALSGNRSNGDA